jgi:hypothetical protein
MSRLRDQPLNLTWEQLANFRQKRIKELEDEIKQMWNSGYRSGVNSDNTDMLAALDKIKELEALAFTAYCAGYEKGNYDTVEGAYSPPAEYPEEWKENVKKPTYSTTLYGGTETNSRLFPLSDQ